MAKVLLTGGSGFIGSHIAELFSSKGIPTKCLLRKFSKQDFIEQLGLEIVYGDLLDLDSLKLSMKDVDFVIHTAGKSSDWGSYQDFYQTNVVGTLNILKACAFSNITNVVITGSVSSYGEENNFTIKDEDSPFNSHYPYFLDKVFPSAMNYYRDTKAILTEEAILFAEENKLNLTVIEPAWVYGEREFNTGFYEYVKAAKDGMQWAPGSKNNKFQVIYAGDLAKAYLLAYENKLSGVERFIIANPQSDKLADIHRLFCQHAGIKAPKYLPKFLVYPAGFLMETFSTWLRQKKPPLLTRARVDMMYDNIEFSGKKAAKLLSFKPGFTLAQGIKKTVQWYIDNGYL